MGYMKHEAVIVTMSQDLDGHPDLAAFTSSMPPKYQQLIRGPFPGIVNNYVTWIFVPDGSKEHWEESDDSDLWRDRFIGLWPNDKVSMVHVTFGGDYGADYGADVRAAKHGPMIIMQEEVDTESLSPAPHTCRVRWWVAEPTTTRR